MMIDIKEVVGIATVILGVVGYLPYLKNVIRGTTRPHVYTWFVWGLITLIIYGLQVSDGAGAGSWVTLVAAFLSLSVFVLGLGQGDRDITKSDSFFLILALVGLGLWLIADQPVLSTILLVSVGMMGFAPTIRKSWNRPHTETLSTYAINSFRHLLSVFALSQYTVVTWLFPVAWGVANGLFVILIIIRRKIRAKN